MAIPTHDGDRCYRASVVVIPWFEADFDAEHLALAKIRQAEGRKPKYVEVFRDGPGLFPSLGLAVIQAGRPLVIVEGEFDALLLDQALAGLTAVVTLGSASNSVRPGPRLLAALLETSPWFLATDADPAGDLVLGGWPKRIRRVRPPTPWKDWTEAFQGGLDLREWWLK